MAWQESARASGKTERCKPAANSLADGQPFKPEELSHYLSKRGIPSDLHRHFKVVDGKLEENILGLPNRYLHPSNRSENDLAATHATDLVLQQLGERGSLDENFIETASNQVHQYWLQRNAGKSWVTAEQKLPFKELSTAEADKDRDVVRRAIEAFRKTAQVEEATTSVKLGGSFN